jgi:serine/threonine-protein kinase
MGSVYLAHDEQLDRMVALKAPSFPPDDAIAMERFAREARAAATIDHPNVCRVYDVGRMDDVPYLTMAYIEGPSLAEALRESLLQPRRAAEIARDIALALAAAHECGVIHRDLKPGNILVGTGGHVFVTDFGLARREKENRLTGEGEIIGTPPYMSPEQIGGETSRIGPASDIYALGVVLNEMLTGAPPFTGPRSQVFLRAISESPPPPSSKVKGLDPRFDRIALRAMAKQPADRFTSMAEFAAALDELLRNDSPLRAWRRWLRWFK